MLRQLARASAVALTLLCSLSQAVAATLKVGVSADMPPMVYHDQGQLSGIEIANAQVIGEYLGYKIKYVEKPRQQLIAALASGEVDVVISGATAADKQLASAAVMDAPVQAVIRFDDAALNAYKGVLFRPGNAIGIVRGSAGARFADELLKNAQRHDFDTQTQALAALKAKRVDFVLLTHPEAQFLARNPDYSDLLAVDHALSEDKVYWLVNQSNTALLQKLNTALTTMQQTGTLRAVINQWLPVSAATNP